MRHRKRRRTGRAAVIAALLASAAGTALTGCRIDDYTHNPSYYTAPGTNTNGAASGTNTAYVPIYTSQDSAPLYAPQPMPATGPAAPVTNGVVMAGTAPGVAGNAAAQAIPPGYTAYRCVPTQVMMYDAYGRSTVGVVQMLQPVGTGPDPSTVAPGTAAAGTGGVMQTSYTASVDPATTIRPLPEYPGYGMMQTPIGPAPVALPPAPPAAAGGATTLNDAPPISGSTLVQPIPAGY